MALTVGLGSDAGPSSWFGLQRVVEAGPGSDRAEGLLGGDAGSGGRGAAP